MSGFSIEMFVTQTLPIILVILIAKSSIVSAIDRNARKQANLIKELLKTSEDLAK